MEIKIFERQKIKNTGLFEDIIKLDIENMKEVFKKSDMEHPVDKRILSFNYPGVLIAGFEGNILAGYLEYGFDRENKNDIHISSIQITPKYRCRDCLENYWLQQKKI